MNNWIVVGWITFSKYEKLVYVENMLNWWIMLCGWWIVISFMINWCCCCYVMLLMIIHGLGLHDSWFVVEKWIVVGGFVELVNYDMLLLKYDEVHDHKLWLWLIVDDNLIAWLVYELCWDVVVELEEMNCCCWRLIILRKINSNQFHNLYKCHETSEFDVLEPRVIPRITFDDWRFQTFDSWSKLAKTRGRNTRNMVLQ